MSILEALARAYDRLPDAPTIGYSVQKIDFVIPLRAGGEPGNPIDLRTLKGKKATPAAVPVPGPVKRSSGIASNFLWDKSAYVLGVGSSKRLEREHSAFVELHRDALSDCDDEGLLALLGFLDLWRPEQREARGWPEEVLDSNLVFALDSDWQQRRRFLHDRPAAQSVWRSYSEPEKDEATRVCLVSGSSSVPARLHPSIKGVWGAQSAGASIVSFNLEAFESYGHKQGDNAPVSEIAAFKYTSILNRFLARDSGHRIQLGDASCVFWADASSADVTAQAEQLAGGMFGGGLEVDEAQQARAIGAMLERIRLGQPLRDVAPALDEGVRFYMLGLAPNAARVAIRFWFEDDFGVLVERYQRYLSDMHVEPRESETPPPMWRYLLETAALHKRENVPPNLAGEWMRAILSGQPYPRTLLSSVVMRTRADKRINSLRVAILRAVLVRNMNLEKEAPVALDTANTNRGYRLGRLFALYEYVQRAAQHGTVNATIKDKFYGAASTRPRAVFPLLDKGAAHHLSKIGKESPGRRVNLEKRLGEILEKMEPGENPFPPTLPLADQALFALGYHHQRGSLFAPTANDRPVNKEDKEPEG